MGGRGTEVPPQTGQPQAEQIATGTLTSTHPQPPATVRPAQVTLPSLQSTIASLSEITSNAETNSEALRPTVGPAGCSTNSKTAGNRVSVAPVGTGVVVLLKLTTAPLLLPLRIHCDSELQSNLKSEVMQPPVDGPGQADVPE